MQAKDIMSRNVISIEEDTSVKEILHLLLAHKISSIPVVDTGGEPIGLVSEVDFLVKMKLPVSLHWLYQYAAYYYEDRTTDEQFKAQATKASEIMSRNPVCVDPRTPTRIIVTLMVHKSIRRVLVVQNAKLVGIVSRADLLKNIIKEKRGRQLHDC